MNYNENNHMFAIRVNEIYVLGNSLDTLKMVSFIKMILITFFSYKDSDKTSNCKFLFFLQAVKTYILDEKKLNISKELFKRPSERK
jgi:hypothetical protein